MKLIATILFAAATLTVVTSVNRELYKVCEQSSFCRRCRKVEANNSPFELVSGTLNTLAESITVDLVNKNNDHIFVLTVEGVQGDVFHVTVDEKEPLKKRYRVTDALREPIKPDAIKVTESGTDIIVECGQNKAIIHAAPFKIDFYRNEVLFVQANAKGLLKFEHYRTKPESPPEGAENQVPKQPRDDVDDEPGAWEEDFNSHHDSKPNGPEAIALDFTFPQASVLFGIPEHADSFALKSTLGGDPYRLHNMDVAYYELDNGMGLYGSVPVIYGHGTNGTAGVFWMNAAETWVDIYGSNSGKNTPSHFDDELPAAHFMTESGIVETFILLGETPLNTFQQYTNLTGVAPLPQHAAFGFHQSRWNYINEEDVRNVSANFDVHDIPLDTMWLDIEYTDRKKYFTWDPDTFPHPLEMIANLTSLGRHLTIIIDPHIKVADDYFVHKDCTEKSYYTKDKDGKAFEGECWPGTSSWPDLFNPEVRKYLADQYLLENFNTTTKDVFIWNDMNEPSVFDGPEQTMPKDNVHNTEMGTFEHRVVHNLYAHMQVISTFDGLYRRGEGKVRPFILTRGHFSGTQRYAAVWTGDNSAEWGHLQVSLKMCLTQAVSGFSFCGADVGGFLTDPFDDELVGRWHQAGAFLPFFRAHSNMGTKRREPWLFPEDTKLVIRDAIRKRYTYLPLWYVLFYEHERSGYPVMRPLLSHYPNDPEAFAIDDQFLLGDRLLVHPVTKLGATDVNVYFPRNSATGNGDYWFDADDFTLFNTAGYVTVPVDSYKIPVYQRGGAVVPRKQVVRSASTLMKNEPYILIVCLDRFNEATGTIYDDDQISYDYRDGKYVYSQIEFRNSSLSSRLVDSTASFETSVEIDGVVIAGLDRVPQSATLSTPSKRLTLDVNKFGNAYSIRSFAVNIAEEWEISLNF